MGALSRFEDSAKGRASSFEDSVKNVGSKIDDEITQPVKNTVEAIAKDPKKLAAVAISVAFPGAGAALGAQLGLSGVAAQVVGQAIINTATNGGDVKAAVISAALPVVGKEVAGTISTTLAKSGIEGAVNTVITDAATRGLTAAALGKDPLAAMVLSGTTSAVNLIAAEIPGFDGLHPSAQSAIKNAVATKLTGGDVGQSLVNSAIAYAADTVATYQKRESAMADLAKAGLDFGTDYSALNDEQKAAVDAIAKASAKTVTGGFFDKLLGRPGNALSTTREELINKYKDSLYTDESEATEMARAILGREPTEFEIMEFLGTTESNAKSVLENIRYDEATFDSNELAESYKALYGKEPTDEWLAKNTDLLGRSDAQAKNMLQNLYIQDKNWVTEDEAAQFWKDTGNTGPAPQAFLDAMLMTSEAGAKAMAETYRINAEDIAATTFDGSQYKTPQEAAAAAKAAGFNAFTHKDKNLTYFTQPSPVEEANIRADVEEKKTFNEAFATARKELGAGKTFTWNGKQYTTNVMPKDTFDASRSSSVTTAATLALANGKDKFIGPDGKTYKLDDKAKSVLANSVNESPAETQRLLRQAIKPATDETAAETQRLMESGTRGTMDTIGAMTAQALGTTQRGLGNFLSNAGKTYAAMTGDLDFDNAAIKLGKEIETYAKGNDIYGLDVQKNRLSQAMARANETDNWIEKTKILGSAIGKNSLGFFDVAGSEVVEELPETILQIGAALMTGGGTLAAKGAVAVIGAAGSVMETFGSTVEDTYEKAKKAGFSNDEAMNKAYLNGVLSTAIEAGTNFVADKALLAPFLNKFTGTLAGTATGFVSNTTIGAASELAAGLSQSYATQYMINPETASLSKAATDGIFEMFIGGTAQGTMGLPGYAIQGGAIIGKDYSGRDVTVADVAAGAVLDSSTVNPNATIATSEDGDPVTLGGAMLQMPNYQFDMSTLKTYVPQVFSNDNLIVGQDELGNNVTFGELTGQVSKDQDFDTVYKNLLNITPEQRTEAKYDFVSKIYEDLGYTPTAQEVNDLIAQSPTVSQIDTSAIEQYVDQRLVTEQEARDAYAALGLNKPTQDDVLKLVGQYDQTGLTDKATANLDSARYNSILDQLDSLSVGASQETLDAIELVKNDLNAQITALGGDVTALRSGVDSLAEGQKETKEQILDLGSQTTGQINELSADVQAKYDALTAEQKALADAMNQQGLDLTAAIDLAAQQTQEQITGLGEQVDTRINELMQQGQTYQEATQQAIGELNQQNQQMQELIGTQGRAATQEDIDALSQMLGGQRDMDLTYDVTGDKQITQADIDWLAGVVDGTNTDWRAPVGSAFGPTGLYGQLATIEDQRQADLQAQLAREEAAKQAAAAAQRQTAIRTTLGQGQQQLQQIAQQLPQAFQQAQTTTTPIYGEMGPYLDLGSPLDFDFFKPSPEKQAATKQQQPTKIATGGYIDDLLAEGMSVDDLMNLLR